METSKRNILSAKLSGLERWVAYAYLVSLPLSLTASWALFISGLSLRLLLLCLDKSARVQSWQSFRSAPLAIPLTVFALAVSLSGAFNSEPVYGQLGAGAFLEAWQSFASLKNLAPYLWAAVVLKPWQGRCRDGIMLLLLVSAVAGIWGSIQQIFNIHPGYKYLQGTGFLAGPMAFAGQMQIFSLLSLSFLLNGTYKERSDDGPSKVAALEGDESAAPAISASLNFCGRLFSFLCNRYVFCGVVICNYAGVLFAGERSAWLGAAAGTLALFWLYWRKLSLKPLLLCLLLASVCATTVPLVRTRIQSLFSGNDVSITARQTIWRKCIDLVPQSPLFGVGIRRFPHFDMPEAIVPGVSKDLNHAHSNYFHILTTTGLIGFAAFVGLFVAFFVAAWRRWRLARQNGDQVAAGIALGLLAAMVSLSVSGIFEYNFGTAQVRLAQWFLLGLL